MSEFDSIDWPEFEEPSEDKRQARDFTALERIGMHAFDLREDLRRWLQAELEDLKNVLDLWAAEPSVPEMFMKRIRYWQQRLRDMDGIELPDAVREAENREGNLTSKRYIGYENVSDAFLYVTDSIHRFGVMSRDLARLRATLEEMGRI